MGRVISLKQPTLRHNRAGEHLADIHTLVETIRAEHKVAISQGDPDPPEQVEIPAEIGDRLRVRIGEHVYNLRASLDYLVYELSGHKRQSQFPIEDDCEDFDARKTGKHPSGRDVRPYLRGVSPKHCDLIERIQPYKLKALDPDERRCWTCLLRSLSNEDKHRKLVALNGLTGQPITREEVRWVSFGPTTNVHTGSRIIGGASQVETKVDFPVEPALKEGLPAYQALEELQTEVGAFLALIERTL